MGAHKKGKIGWNNESGKDEEEDISCCNLSALHAITNVLWVKTTY